MILYHQKGVKQMNSNFNSRLNIEIDSVIKRIYECIHNSGLSYAELSNRTGIAKSALHRYATGQTKKIPIDAVRLIADATGVSTSYIMGWEDNKSDYKINPSKNYDLSQYENISPVKLKRFPMLGEIACGEPIWAEEDRESYVMADMDIRADFCLTAKGDSMVNARIYDGDIVFICEMPIVENGEIAAVIIGDEATLKRWYYYREDNKLMLIAENPKYEPLVYMNEELDTIKCLGKAVYFMSAL